MIKKHFSTDQAKKSEIKEEFNKLPSLSLHLAALIKDAMDVNKQNLGKGWLLFSKRSFGKTCGMLTLELNLSLIHHYQ